MRNTESLTAAFVTLIIVFHSTSLPACPNYRSEVKAGVYNGDFLANLFVLLLPLAVLCLIGIGIYFSDAIVAKLKTGKGDL